MSRRRSHFSSAIFMLGVQLDETLRKLTSGRV
jgi:hypothetical protein